jgi:hypothetical protein
MARIVRLTERDLTRIVKRVIMEQKIMSDATFEELYNGLKNQGISVKKGNDPKKGKFLYSGLWVIWADNSINNGYPISSGDKMYKWSTGSYNSTPPEATSIIDKSGKKYNLSFITQNKYPNQEPKTDRLGPGGSFERGY